VSFIPSRSTAFCCRTTNLASKRNITCASPCFELTGTSLRVMRRCSARCKLSWRKAGCRKKNFWIRRSGSPITAGRIAHSALLNLCLPKGNARIAEKFSSRNFPPAANPSREIVYRQQRRRFPETNRNSGAARDGSLFKDSALGLASGRDVSGELF
jgi:hypothetical protein